MACAALYPSNPLHPYPWLPPQANNMVINSKTEQVFVSGYDKQKGGSVVFELDWANGTLSEVVAVPGQVQNNLCAFAPQTNSFILVRTGDAVVGMRDTWPLCAVPWFVPERWSGSVCVFVLMCARTALAQTTTNADFTTNNLVVVNTVSKAVTSNVLVSDSIQILMHDDARCAQACGAGSS